MPSFQGAHVTTLDELGLPADVDGVSVSIAVRGSFRIRYAANINKVCVEIARWGEYGDVSMRLTTEQALALRDLLDAGIADALAGAAVELTAGGDPA